MTDRLVCCKTKQIILDHNAMNKRGKTFCITTYFETKSFKSQSKPGSNKTKGVFHTPLEPDLHHQMQFSVTLFFEGVLLFWRGFSQPILSPSNMAAIRFEDMVNIKEKSTYFTLHTKKNKFQRCLTNRKLTGISALNVEKANSKEN